MSCIVQGFFFLISLSVVLQLCEGGCSGWPSRSLISCLLHDSFYFVCLCSSFRFVKMVFLLFCQSVPFYCIIRMNLLE